jgi:hypothetical protein
VFHTIFLTTSTQYARTVGLLAAALIATQLLLILWGRSTDASVSVFAVASAICLAVSVFRPQISAFAPSPQNHDRTQVR